MRTLGPGVNMRIERVWVSKFKVSKCLGPQSMQNSLFCGTSSRFLGHALPPLGSLNPMEPLKRKSL